MMRALPRPVLWLAVFVVLAFCLISALTDRMSERQGVYVQPLLRVTQSGNPQNVVFRAPRN